MRTHDGPSPAEARAARRRHLQQRQTVIFGVLIAALLVIGLTAGAMWVGILPTPVNIPIRSPEPTAEANAGPCPPADSVYVPYNEISANVLNGTNVTGLAASTAAALGERGIVVGQQGNAARFAGTARIVAGPSGLAAAYTVAEIFPDATIEVDDRTEGTVDVVVGAEYEAIRPPEEVTTEFGAPIPAPQGCTPVTVPTAEG